MTHPWPWGFCAAATLERVMAGRKEPRVKVAHECPADVGVVGSNVRAVIVGLWVDMVLSRLLL